MSTNNPVFENVERAPYELLRLVAQLGVTPVANPLTAEQLQIAAAIHDHAGNATNTILSGLEAIGRAISCAAQNPHWQLSPANFSDIGGLIAHLAVEAQALHDAADDARHDIERSLKTRAKPVGGQA